MASKKELEELSFEGTKLILPDGRKAESSDMDKADFCIRIYAGTYGTLSSPLTHNFAGTFGGKAVYARTYWKYIKE